MTPGSRSDVMKFKHRKKPKIISTVTTDFHSISTVFLDHKTKREASMAFKAGILFFLERNPWKHRCICPILAGIQQKKICRGANRTSAYATIREHFRWTQLQPKRRISNSDSSISTASPSTAFIYVLDVLCVLRRSSSRTVLVLRRRRRRLTDL